MKLQALFYYRLLFGGEQVVSENLAETVLFTPLRRDVNELYILSGYATPNMLSWYITNIQHRTQSPIKIHLLVGMVPFDRLSVSVHEGFIQLVSSALPQEVELVECSYICEAPAVHSNIYIWAKDGAPAQAFMGSANFVQSSFVGHHRQELMTECDPAEAMQYYQAQVGRSIYCTHGEIEEYVVLQPTHPVLDLESNLIDDVTELANEGIDFVTLSLVTRTGEPGSRSGLNWGQRPRRDPNEAYISLPARIARSNFFPMEYKHFTAITDDRHQLTLRIEQQNDKAITTPARNSDLGEYFRNRLGLANGAYITRADLERYGRTNVVFYKLDDETYYMDFSV
ncbi:MAG: NgoFVII family restriction endonuclease [Oscillospiraceae bacterium]|nr:NgoFVII family restriction endonuclease [Oscillospiraceae bacterium]